jgi:penicillin-binding protein 1A
MAEEGYITLEEARKAAKAPLVLHPADFSPNPLAGYFLDVLWPELEKRLGREELLTGGYTVYTTLDLRWQEGAQEALLSRLKSLARRHPETKRLPQGAIVCLENSTGNIRVLIGGRDYEKSQFNRALQARRQPGSAFKPIVWSAALEKDLVNVATLMVDEPVVLPGAEADRFWQPKNFDHTYLGPISLRTALVHSRNTVAVKLAKAVGLPDLLQTAHLFEIKSPLSRNYSIALGSAGLSLFELTRAYTVFPNRGKLVKPSLIESIFDRDGHEVFRFKPVKRPVISPKTAYMMTYLLQEVVRDGTGRCARKLGVPTGAKTGTTDNYHDAWFIGFTAEVTCGVWVGHDDLVSLGKLETGARAACPVWVAAMEARPEGFSGKGFDPPEGIVLVKKKDFDPLRGQEVLWMPFREGTVPEPKPTWPKFLGVVPLPRIFWW